MARNQDTDLAGIDISAEFNRIADNAMNRDAKEDDVSAYTDTYTKMVPHWDVIAALLGGTTGMRQKKQTYLPQEEGEGSYHYDQRLARTYLFNAFEKTVETNTGRPFSRPIEFENFNQALLDLNDNIDLVGDSIDIFARQVFATALAYGHTFIFVDHSVNPEQEGAGRVTTLLDEKEMGLRPFWEHIKAQNIIGWRSTVVNGFQVPTQVRIKDQVVRDVGAFGTMAVERIRVLMPGWIQVFEQDSKTRHWNLTAERPLLTARGTPYPGIPIVPFYCNSEHGFFVSDPRLIDLAWLNINHWQSSSAQDNILRLARLPILFGTGLGEVDIKIGESVWTSAPEGGTLQFVEHSGAGIQAGRDNLEDIENRMRIMGSELLVRDPARVTATEKILNTDEATSELQAMAINFESALEHCYRFTATWLGLGLEAVGDVHIFRDYGISANRFQDAQALLAARTAKQISQGTFLSRMKKIGMLDEDLDIEAEIALTETEAPDIEIGGMDEEPDNQPNKDDQNDQNNDEGGDEE